MFYEMLGDGFNDFLILPPFKIVEMIPTLTCTYFFQVGGLKPPTRDVCVCKNILRKFILKATAEWQEVPHNAICPATFSAGTGIWEQGLPTQSRRKFQRFLFCPQNLAMNPF